MSKWSEERIWQLCYGLAVVTVTLALILTLLLLPVLHKTPAVLFFAAVMISSWYGGFGAGILATILSVFSIDYFVLPPRFALSYAETDFLLLGVFVLVASLISWLNAKRIKAESELRQAKEELERKVAERTQNLRQANKQLQQVEQELRSALEKERELNELKSRIISVISHEYRTPLTTILSSTELLERYDGKLTSEKKLTHFQRIKNSIQHMTNLISDVLFIGKAEADRLEFNPTPLNLKQFCWELVEELRSGKNSQTTISFSSQCNCTDSNLDEKLLRQILTNLLSNAIKYSPNGGTVRFELECSSGKARFRIQDEGIGIPEADLPLLFESFYRAPNVGTIPGTGLGLAIVKKCVDLHKGHISVDSVVGISTTFTVTLPSTLPMEADELFI
jgi:signal transduction histidine kinase